MMAFYRLVLTPDDDGSLLVTCRDFPELTTFGETREDAIRHAGDAILEAIAARIAEGREVPRLHSVRKAGQPVAQMPYGAQVKIGLYRAFREAGVSRAELGRRLGWHREQVDRLFRLDHASRPDQVEAAFDALGYELSFGFERRAQPQVV